VSRCVMVIESVTLALSFVYLTHSIVSPCPGPPLNAWNEIHSLFNDPLTGDTSQRLLPAECLLVIDSGYSNTTVTPVYNGHALQRGIRRLDISKT
jgi:actin-related protein